MPLLRVPCCSILSRSFGSPVALLTGSTQFARSGSVHHHYYSQHQTASFFSFTISSSVPRTNCLLSPSRVVYQVSFGKQPHGSIRHISQSISPSARAFTSTHRLPSLSRVLLGVTLGTVILVPVAGLQALDGERSLSSRDSDSQTPLDPIDALLPDFLAETSSHLAHRPTADLLRSYLTFLMCEIPGLVTYGPLLLNGYKGACDNVPFLGGLAWKVAEWLMYQTFFSHYTGGESSEECEPVLKSLYAHDIGTLLNYSVEGAESTNAFKSPQSNDCQVSRRHIDAIALAVETASTFGSPPNQKVDYPVGSARMKPTTLALKVSGLVTDPYLFKRASDSLIVNNISPFKVGGDLFPASRTPTDPLSESDRLALKSLLADLRGLCKKAKANDVALMIDAEYSWFQPALDRLATFLSEEFNRPVSSESPSSPQFYSPTVYNTFQALLRSTPSRVDEFIAEADKHGFSIGIKLVRGAYLVSETNHWKEEVSQTGGKHSLELPVWTSKEETDRCFDSIASKLVHRLSEVAKHAEKIGKEFRKHNASAPHEVSLMIAGHNVNSVSKLLRQLREEEGLVRNDTSQGSQKLILSDCLRGRIMFAQLYGMADNLTSTLANMLVSISSSSREVAANNKDGIQPFVHKYLPFGPVSEVMPYLARRAEENQSMLQNCDGRSGVAAERRLIGKELRHRILSIFS